MATTKNLANQEAEAARLQEYHYPLAAAPDIIRSNQKDTYFQGVLLDDLSTVLRKLYGVRFTHKYTSEVRTLTELVYFGCTTLIGNRTLGEEYCDIIQVEGGTMSLPSILRRSAYIMSSVIFPYILQKVLPAARASLRISLESRLSVHVSKKESTSSIIAKVQSYILENLSTLTSPSHFYALSLSIFYCNGAYYHLSKRLAGLNYVFTKRIEPSDQRIGYEVLGVLLLLQISVQIWLHIQKTMTTNSYVGGNVLTMNSDDSGSASQTPDYGVTVPRNTHTPILQKARYALSEPNTLGWIDGMQQRKCTLCLEELKDPSVTTCGHVFCWTCITDWIREKPECPLCRQQILSQHVLPIRG